MSKVIAVMEKPKDCQHCVFCMCKYSLPLSTRRKGYFCTLMNPQDRKVEDFAYEEEVHLSNCPLQEVAKEYGKDTNVRSYEDGYADGAESVRALAPYEDDWIPCSERLPEGNDLTHYEITFLSSFDKPYRSVAIFSKGEWYMPGTHCRDYDLFPYEVIAWKEPSAPYQKGE